MIVKGDWVELCNTDRTSPVKPYRQHLVASSDQGGALLACERIYRPHEELVEHQDKTSMKIGCNDHISHEGNHPLCGACIRESMSNLAKKD